MATKYKRTSLKGRFMSQLITKFGEVCWYCGISLRDRPKHIDHIKPVRLGGQDDIENVALSCKFCNFAKWYSYLDEFYAWIEHPDNPRTIADDALKGLTASLATFGLIQPIIWNKRTGRIVGGHQRKKALDLAGYTHAHVLVVDYDEKDELGALLSLNNPRIQGEFTDGTADLLLRYEEWQPAEFRDLMLGDLLTDLNGETARKKGLTDADDVPEPPKKAVVKTGERWILGDHHLICGDSLTLDTAVLSLANKKADMVFTDPPYNIGYGKTKRPRSKMHEPIAGDDMIPADWLIFCARTVAVIKALTDGCVYVCHAPGPDGRAMAAMLDGALHSSTTVIWVKDSFTLGRGKYQNQYEPIWFGWVKDGGRFSERRDLTNVWHVPRPKRSDEHPTMKPVDLVSTAIEHGTSRGQSVLDLFGGSGTTLMAAEVADRRALLVEIEPRYCDVIISRWEQFTGKAAKRA